MKPNRTAAQRWRKAGQLVSFLGLLVFCLGAGVLGWSIVKLQQRSPDTPQKSFERPVSLESPTSRPSLVFLLTARSIRQPLNPAPEPLAPAALIEPVPPATSGSLAPPPPAVEVLATYTSDTDAGAYVRYKGSEKVVLWPLGKSLGYYTVTQIREGSVTLHGEGAQHVLRVEKRLR